MLSRNFVLRSSAKVSVALGCLHGQQNSWYELDQGEESQLLELRMWSRVKVETFRMSFSEGQTRGQGPKSFWTSWPADRRFRAIVRKADIEWRRWRLSLLYK